MSKINDIIGELNKDPKLTTFNQTDSGEIMDWYPTLIPVFDYNMVGGVPASGRVSQAFGKPSSGKGHTPDTPIPTPEGMKTIGDLKVGDYVFDRFGKPTKVLGIYHRGKMDLYKVTLQDNSSVTVSKDHIWSLMTSRNRLKEVTTEELLNNDQKPIIDKRGNTTHYSYHIPLNKWVMFNPRPYEVNPYVVGALLGDGCLSERQLTISSDDKFVVDKVASLLPYDCEAQKNSDYNYNWTFKLKEEHSIKRNKSITRVQAKDIVGRLFSLPMGTCDKFIPEEYMYNTLEVRYQVAQGLIDTDGSIRGNKGNVAQIEWTSVNEKLAKQFKSLLKSLGYNTYMSKKVRDRRDEGRGVETDYNIIIKGRKEDLEKDRKSVV